jgi:hypothetical protein
MLLVRRLSLARAVQHRPARLVRVQFRARLELSAAPTASVVLAKARAGRKVAQRNSGGSSGSSPDEEAKPHVHSGRWRQERSLAFAPATALGGLRV